MAKYKWIDFTETKTTSSNYTKTFDNAFAWDIYFYVYQSTTGATSSSVTVQNNTTTIFSDTSTFNVYQAEISKHFNLTENGTFSFTLTRGSTNRTYNIIVKQNKCKNDVKSWLPRDLKNIWEKGNITTFWMHTDENFIHDNQDYLKGSNDEYTANTTFDITAYRWYIYIKFWNKEYKVPYVSRA